MVELNNDNFEAEVLLADGLVLVDFWGPKCEPCLMLLPEVEKMSEKYGNRLKFCKLNVAVGRKAAISQKIMGLPAIIIYKNGERIKEISGFDICTPEAVEELIKEIAE